MKTNGVATPAATKLKDTKIQVARQVINDIEHNGVGMAGREATLGGAQTTREVGAESTKYTNGLNHNNTRERPKEAPIEDPSLELTRQNEAQMVAIPGRKEMGTLVSLMCETIETPIVRVAKSRLGAEVRKDISMLGDN